MANIRSLYQRDQLVSKLVFAGNSSQWLNAPPYRSCFVIVVSAIDADWTIEGLLPSGQIVPLGSYAGETGPFMAAGGRGYITVNAMCGIPIRFTSTLSQATADIWVVLKA